MLGIRRRVSVRKKKNKKNERIFIAFVYYKMLPPLKIINRINWLFDMAANFDSGFLFICLNYLLLIKTIMFRSMKFDAFI